MCYFLHSAYLLVSAPNYRFENLGLRLPISLERVHIVELVVYLEATQTWNSWNLKGQVANSPQYGPFYRLPVL